MDNKAQKMMHANERKKTRLKWAFQSYRTAKIDWHILLLTLWLMTCVCVCKLIKTFALNDPVKSLKVLQRK